MVLVLVSMLSMVSVFAQGRMGMGMGDMMQGKRDLAQEPGVMVLSVIADSPAAKAGLKRADIVLSFDGKVVNYIRDIMDILRTSKAGQKVALSVQRGSEKLNISLVLEDRIGKPLVGIIPVPGGMSENPVHGGMLVQEVQAGSPAEKGGLKSGDVIVGFAGKDIDDDLPALVAQRKAGETIKLEVLRRADQTGMRGPMMNHDTANIEVTLASKDGKPWLGVVLSSFDDGYMMSGRGNQSGPMGGMYENGRPGMKPGMGGRPDYDRNMMPRGDRRDDMSTHHELLAPGMAL